MKYILITVHFVAIVQIRSCCNAIKHQNITIKGMNMWQYLVWNNTVSYVMCVYKNMYVFLMYEVLQEGDVHFEMYFWVFSLLPLLYQLPPGLTIKTHISVSL